MDNFITVTPELLERARSSNGGWRPQLDLFCIRLGQQGWRKNLIGRQVPARAMEKFIALKDKHLAPLPEMQMPMPPIKNEQRRLLPQHSGSHALIDPDGSCDNRTGCGGWAAIVIVDYGQPREMSGKLHGTTCNRAELLPRGPSMRRHLFSQKD